MHATGRVLRAACRQRDCRGNVARDPATVIRGRTDGANILNIIGEVGYGNPDDTGLPELLHQAALGNSIPLGDSIASFTQGNSPPIAEYSDGWHVATWCADTDWPWRSCHATYRQRTRTLRAEIRRTPASAFCPFDRRTARIVAARLRWLDAPEHRVRRRLPRVPVLLLGGDRDLLTPIEWLRAEARPAPEHTVVVVHGASHSLQLHAAHGLAAAQEFSLRTSGGRVVGWRFARQFKAAAARTLAVTLDALSARVRAGRVKSVSDEGRAAGCWVSLSACCSARLSAASATGRVAFPADLRCRLVFALVVSRASATR
jgi:hypothetical protein